MNSKKDEEMLKEPPKAYAQMLKKEQDELVLSYMPALRAMAFRLKERLPSSIDVNDLISIGVEEMIKLSRRYDKEQNDNFWGFARKRVNGSMLDYLRSLDVMSRNNRKIIKDSATNFLYIYKIHNSNMNKNIKHKSNKTSKNQYIKGFIYTNNAKCKSYKKSTNSEKCYVIFWPHNLFSLLLKSFNNFSKKT